MKKRWYEEIKEHQPNYDELLNTYDWSIMRFKVLRRDKFKCSKCGHTNSSRFLHVHHTEYIKGLLPWEYDTEFLITLCDECHADEHGLENPQISFRKGLSEYIKSLNIQI